MAGVGKSAIARRLGTRLGRETFDVDGSVVKRRGEPITAIFEHLGESGFRDLESEQLLVAIDSPEPLVIATGGGIIERPANRQTLAEHCDVIWLSASDAVLADRLRNSSVKRPLLEGDLVANLARLNAARSALYSELAHAEVPVGDLDLDQATDAVIAHLDNLHHVGGLA